MNGTHRPARRDEAGPTPRFVKKARPKRLSVTWPSDLQGEKKKRANAREASGHAGPEEVVACEDGCRHGGVTLLEVTEGKTIALVAKDARASVRSDAQEDALECAEHAREVQGGTDRRADPVRAGAVAGPAKDEERDGDHRRRNEGELEALLWRRLPVLAVLLRNEVVSAAGESVG